MYLLFDIGGTKIRLAISRDRQTFISYETFITPPSINDGMDKIGQYIKKQEVGIQAIVGGIAGVLDLTKSKLTFSPNLAQWVGVDLKSELSTISETDNIILENDAALNGLGEAVYGGGKGSRIVAYITVGTGIGGTRIIDQKIDSAKLNFEPGHQLLIVKNMLCTDDPSCRCDEETSDLESLISGAAFEKMYGAKLQDLKDEKVWDRIYHYLAIGLNNVCVFWSPEIIILGGGVIGSSLFSVKILETHLKNILKAYPDAPVIKKTTLGEHAGLYGALQILKQS